MHGIYKYQKKKKKEKATSALLRCCFGSQSLLCHSQALAPCSVALQGGWSIHSLELGMRLGDCSKLVSIWFSFKTSSLSCFGIKQTCILRRARLSTAFLLFPLVLHPGKEVCLPCVKPQGCGVQYLGQTTHSPGKISTHSTCVMFPFSEAPSRVTGPNPTIASLIFLPDSMWILLTALFVRESFCQFPVSFQWKLFHT